MPPQLCGGGETLYLEDQQGAAWLGGVEAEDASESLLQGFLDYSLSPFLGSESRM